MAGTVSGLITLMLTLVICAVYFIDFTTLFNTTMQRGRHWSPAMKEQFLLDWQLSGRSLYYFCQHHDPPVAYSTAKDWRNIYEMFGNIDHVADVLGFEPRGRKATLDMADIVTIIDIIARHPTWYLYEVQDEFTQLTNKNVSLKSIWEAFNKFKITKKKITKLRFIN